MLHSTSNYWLVVEGQHWPGPDLVIIEENNEVVKEYKSATGWYFPSNPERPFTLTYILDQYVDPKIHKISKEKYLMLKHLWT